jgi:hypothetical protein
MKNTTLAQRLEAIHAIKNYLQVLSILTKRPVKKEDLISLEKTLEIIDKSKLIRALASKNFEIDFEDRTSDQFKNFIENLDENKRSPIFIWSKGANSCGLFQVSSLLEINFDFEYEIDGNGVFIFTSADLQDQLLVDFYENNEGQRKMKIEIYGNLWSKTNY